MDEETSILELPGQTTRASFIPETFDASARTVELIWSTGATVRRGSYSPFDETLSLDPAHVRLERLNNGAPFLESHGPDFFGATSQDGLDTAIGIVERAWIVSATEARAIVRFADTPRGRELMNRVADGTLRNISVGYFTHKAINVTQDEDDVTQIRVVDWEPVEISLVASQADPGAVIRSGQSTTRTYPCVISRERPAADMDDEEEIIEPGQDENTRSADAEQGDQDPQPSNEPAPASQRGTSRTEPAPAPSADAAGDDSAAVAIMERCSTAGLPLEFATDLVREGVSTDVAFGRIIDEVAQRRDGGGTVNIAPRSSGARVGTEERTKVRTGVQEAILHRYLPSEFPQTEGARAFQGLPLLEIGRECLKRAGQPHTGMPVEDLAMLTLGIDPEGGYGTRAAGMGRTDFPLITGAIFGKLLRRGYTEAPQTFAPFVRTVTVRDFKEVNRIQLGEAPQLLQINEHGEYQLGAIGEAAEKYAIKKHGRRVMLTWEAIVDDDMDAFTRIPSMMGSQARRKESQLVYAILNSNPTMADGIPLFHVDHGNLGSGAIDQAGLDAMYEAMALQKGLDGVTELDITPEYVIAPVQLRGKARRELVLETVPTKQDDTNAHRDLTPIIDPRLSSATEWFAATVPGQVDTIELAHLEGHQGPSVQTRQGWEVDGVEYKVRHLAVAAPIDWRGLYKSTG